MTEAKANIGRKITARRNEVLIGFTPLSMVEVEIVFI